MKKITIGGMSSRFGIGMISLNKICIAVRLAPPPEQAGQADGQIKTFCRKIVLVPGPKILELPFIRALAIVRQVYLMARMFYGRSVRDFYSVQKVSVSPRGLEMILKFIIVYFFTIVLYGYWLLLADFWGQYQFILEKISFIVMSLFFIVLFVRLVMGKRILRYHGAEHKAINLFYSGQDLTVTNARQASRIALKCGTTVVWFVIILETILYSFIIFSLAWYWLLPLTFIVFFVLLSVAYELVRVLVRFENHFWAKLIYYPALWFQRLTTAEPTDRDLELALAALKELLKS